MVRLGFSIFLFFCRLGGFGYKAIEIDKHILFWDEGVNNLSLHLETEIHGSILLVRLSGELDHHAAGKMRSQLEELMKDQRIKHLVLNLKQLSFMDSSGLGVILGRYKQLSSKNGQMVVCSMSPTVYRLFELAGMFKILTVKESEEEALSSLGVA
jgi:stage II sporulation protein AA (anti-sigma F factor antagonist)